MTSGNTSSSAAASIKGCCCCLILLFSFLALLSLAVILIIVFAIKPKKPQFDLQQVTVQYLNLNFNPFDSDNNVALLFHMLFNAKNENVAGIKYSDSTFSIMYRGVPVGRGVVRGFYQAARSQRKVVTTVSVDRTNLLQADAAALARDVMVNDRVELRVMGDVKANIRVIGITSPTVQVSIDCAIVISPSKQSLVSKQCGLDGLQVPMDFSELTDAMASRSYHKVADICDQLMLQIASQGVLFHDEWPYAVHLLGHIYLNDLNSARFLWKSIPLSIEESRPEVAAIWKIGQQLWTRNYAGVYDSIRGFNWSAEIQDFVASFADRYTRRMLELLMSAYSTISIQDTALFLGMNESDATSYVLQQGWTVDAASQMLTVKKHTVVTEQKIDPSKLQRLTEYVFHLEH